MIYGWSNSITDRPNLLQFGGQISGAGSQASRTLIHSSRGSDKTFDAGITTVGYNQLGYIVKTIVNSVIATHFPLEVNIAHHCTSLHSFCQTNQDSISSLLATSAKQPLTGWNHPCLYRLRGRLFAAPGSAVDSTCRCLWSNFSSNNLRVEQKDQLISFAGEFSLGGICCVCGGLNHAMRIHMEANRKSSL